MNVQIEKTDAENSLFSSVWKHFSNVRDPRVKDNQTYRFIDLMVLIICAMICGANNIETIVNYIESKIDWFKQYLPIKKAPSYHTIWWILVLMDPQELHQAFSSFLKEASSILQNPPEKQSIAIDGKTCRGTAREHLKAIHVVSAWSSSFRLVLGQTKTEKKSNEITAIPKLLQSLDLESKVITIDAMGCQSKIAKQILKGKGDYIFSLKGNQSNLHKEVQAIFAMSSSFVEFEEFTELEKGHGRIEQRTIRVHYDVGDLGKDWKNIKSVIEVTATRTLKGKQSTEKRYYISSLQAKASQYLKWIRNHWGVESFHWVLDVGFKEDDFQGHTMHLAENFSLLVRLTFNLLSQEKTLKKSLPQKRNRASWNHEYLLKVLNM